MATFNAKNFDQAELTLFFRTNRRGVPVPLPFQIITVDHDDSYYQPLSLSAGVSDDGMRQRGIAAGAVYLDKNRALPQVDPSKRAEDHAVWEYHGI